MKIDKYKMGDLAKGKMKTVQEEKKALEKNLSRMKTECITGELMQMKRVEK